MTCSFAMKGWHHGHVDGGAHCLVNRAQPSMKNDILLLGGNLRIWMERWYNRNPDHASDTSLPSQLPNSAA